MNPKRILTVLTLTLAAGSLGAQETTGTLAGRVTDKAGNPIAGARVVISSPQLLGERTIRTDASGHFRIPLLNNGSYTIAADAAQYLGSKGSFHVLAGQTSHFDLALKPSRDLEKIQSATVEVVASAALVDKTETVTQSNFSTETLSQLGTNDNLLLLVGSLTPGLSSSDLMSQSSLMIRGGSGHGTKTLLNGATMTEEGGGYLLETGTLSDMIDSVAVIQSPLNARYGNTDGGIVSMVTTKGSNTFSGSLRLTASRADWGADNVPYPNRAGVSSSYNPPTDGLNRTWEISIKGPIWKDHITFAYGGKFIPDQYWPNTYPLLQNTPGQTTDANGIFYRDPANGAVIRKTNLWNQGQINTDVQSESYNQFVVFVQLSTNHSLEWNYTQDDQDYMTNYNVIDGNWRGNDAYKLRTWNLAYKGIVGQNGVLEARYAHTTRAFPHGYSPDNPPINLMTYATNTPDGNGAYGASSLLQGYDLNSQQVLTNGFPYDRGDTFKAETLSINYEHMLEAAGSHLIDLGMEQELFRWNTQAAANAETFYLPGQIASNLTAGDITGASGANPANYAGKYIVFNGAANQSNLDPTYPNEPLIGSPYEPLIPQVTVLSGNPSGAYWMVTDSYYLNDLWTFNPHHSIMAGVRYDQFTVKDTTKTIAAYGLPTVRFEYKWDIFGNQSRMVNLSFGQFHSRQPGSLFYPMVNGRLANSTTYYWNQGSTTPYLVDQAAVLNLSNYGYVANQTFAGDSFQVDPHWKAPVSNELTAGWRRTYTNGGYLRTTFIYKWWNNLFDFYPGAVYTTQAGTPGFHSVLMNNSSLNRTYKSLEVEWMVPFTQKFSFGGNYTFARLTSNVRSMFDNPSRNATQANNSANFTSWLDTYLPQNQGNVETERLPEHMIKWYGSYDLSSGKVKANLAIRGSYTSGLPMSRSFTYATPYAIIPGYYDGPNGPNTQKGGLVNTVTQYYSPGQFTNQDVWNANLTYNVEMPILRSLVGFLQVQVNNFLNTRILPQYVLPAQAARDPFGGPATRNPYGYQLGQNLVNVGTANTSATGGTSNPIYYRDGLRTITVQTGLRF